MTQSVIELSLNLADSQVDLLPEVRQPLLVVLSLLLADLEELLNALVGLHLIIEEVFGGVEPLRHQYFYSVHEADGDVCPLVRLQGIQNWVLFAHLPPACLDERVVELRQIDL